MRVIAYSDTVLVPLSLFLTVGYHAYLWHNIKHKPAVTTIGHDEQQRKAWFLALKEVIRPVSSLPVVQMLDLSCFDRR